jgi:hypothetical protein
MAHAAANDLQRVNRKSIIGIALALLVAILALTFWADQEPPAVSMVFEAVSYADAGYVLFIVTNSVTNTMYSQIQEQQQTNGQWCATHELRREMLRINGQRGVRYSRAVPDTTNAWRLVAHYNVLPDNTFVMRARYKLMTVARQRQWSRLAGWLNPVKMRTIYGPEMLGNKPVGKK